ncbi:MAG: regulatory protein RecX [bacterium]
MSEIEVAAVRLLATREHSRRELQDKLARRFPQSEISDALESLAAQGLQSDERYTEQYVHSRTNKGFGPLRIRRELAERGIGDNLISQYLDDRDPAWRQLAIAVACQKFGDQPAVEYREKARRGRFLEQRGFSTDLIWGYLES